MTKVLVWIEPFPIRDNPTEFLDHAMFLAQAMLHLAEAGVTYSLFSSSAVTDRLRSDYPACAAALRWPTKAEQSMLDDYNVVWSTEQQKVWFDLVRGTGIAHQSYGQMASRVLAEEKPDVVVTWSDNDTLRAAAEAVGCPVLHCELGPTRSPFQPTFYLDPRGTNGSASFRRISEVPPRKALSNHERILELAEPRAPQGPRLATLAETPRNSEWMPERPFVFVPLQLADDLNTSLHSEFENPKQFLEATIPAFLAAGYDVLLKGHPNVKARSSNLQSEEAALQFAETFGDRVRIAPRHLGVADQMACIGQSAMVCTINSSIGFESMLLGRPCVLLGDAAFDLSGILKRRVRDLNQIFDMLPSDSDQNGILDAMMRHFLHPKDTGRVAEVLYEAIGFAKRNPDKGFDDPQALADWTAHCDHSEPYRRSMGSDAPSSLKGYLEDVTEQEAEAGRLKISIVGWVFDAGADLPAGPVRVRAGDDLLAETEIKTSRPDVARSMGARTISLRFALEFETDAEEWENAVIICSGADGRDVRFPIRKGRMLPLSDSATRWSAPVATFRNGRKVSSIGNRVGRAKQWVAQALSGS